MVILEISTIESVKIQSFTLKLKKKHLEPKLVISGLEFEKNYCHICNQYPRICQYSKFHVKGKKIEFGMKVSYLGICRPKFEKLYGHI